MAAKVKFSATLPDGTVTTRTSGTMPYVAISYGSQIMWHKTMASAMKAAVGRGQTYRTGVPAKVIPVTPVAIEGKLGTWSPHIDGWGDISASAFTALVEAKLK